MGYARVMRLVLGLLLLNAATTAHAITFDFKAVKLTAAQRSSLERFVAGELPSLMFDWNSLEAHASSMDRAKQPLAVSLNSVPARTPSGVCRNEQHHFYIEGRSGHWRADDNLTTLQAWIAPGGDCAAVASPITVEKSLNDEEFITLERNLPALQKRAAGVVSGSDCARVRYCAVALRHIRRVQENYPSRLLTQLTFTPLQPGSSCLYVMELSFVGPLNDLVPLGAKCPMS